MSSSEWRATFVTAVDLLRDAADALDNDPGESVQEPLHPQDAFYAALGALEVVAGLAIAATNKASRQNK